VGYFCMSAMTAASIVISVVVLLVAKCASEKFWGMLLLAMSALMLYGIGRYSGQTYRPCNTDFVTMKQECK